MEPQKRGRSRGSGGGGVVQLRALSRTEKFGELSAESTSKGEREEKKETERLKTMAAATMAATPRRSRLKLKGF